MSIASTIEEELDYLKSMHALFYREYVESGDDYGERDKEALALSYQAKASYYRLRAEMFNPLYTIHPN